jgi:O-acetylhomoserine/O-acetylserine sulfhydrylase-like pyridoxal-dependent enzyme
MIAIPKSQAAATQLLEEYADLDSRIALLEEDRSIDIAAANQRADTAAAPMLERCRAIEAQLANWWPHAAANIAGGRKSVQLGGCIIGTRKSRAKLAHSFENDDKAVEALRGTRFANHTTKVKYSLDRAATLKLIELGGKTGASIRDLGFSIDVGSDQFFVERVQQDRTVGS